MKRQILSIALLAGLCLSTVAPALAAPAAANKLGQVRVIVHGLSVQQPRHKAAKGKVNASLYASYMLRTKAKQRASIGFRDGTLLHLNQRTDIVLSNPHITLVKQGEVDELDRPGSNHQVVTASAVASAIGRNFDVRVVKKRSIFIVAFGSVTVKNKKGAVILTRNQETSVQPNQPPSPPQTVDADAAIGWNGPLAGWQVLGHPFASPAAVTADPQGNVYVADTLNNQVVKLDTNGKQILTWSKRGGGSGPMLQPNGIAEPYAVAVDKAGNIYAGDTIFGHIVKMSPAGVELAVFGTKGKQPGQLDGPLGLAVDASGNIFESDTFSARVQELSPSGQPLAVWGSGNSLDHSPGQFFLPGGLFLDAHGTLYVADTGNRRIQRLVGVGQ